VGVLKLNIVNFEHRHIDTVVRLMQYYQRYSIYRNSDFDGMAVRKNIEAQLGNPMVKGWALEDSKGECHGVVLVMVGSGYGAFYTIAMDTFYAVGPKAKGRGIMLLNQCVRWAKEKPEIKRVVFNLSAGTPDQSRTEKLYKRIGMTCVGSSWSMEV